jgi:hypothetical protein
MDADSAIESGRGFHRQLDEFSASSKPKPAPKTKEVAARKK